MKGSKTLLVKRLSSWLKLFLDRIEKSKVLQITLIALTHKQTLTETHPFKDFIKNLEKTVEQKNFHPKALEKVFQ